VTVRPATPADVAAVAALEQELFGPDAWSEAQVREELLGERRSAWVVGDPVVGYVVTATAGEVVDLQRIAVHAPEQRRGLARQLLEAALGAGRGVRADRMLLEVGAPNDAALAFYARAGFVEIDRRRRYYRDGTDAVVMRLPLAAAAPGRRG
jgi:[ribosomal protein S18]-alanine N-acetyltransferase